MPLATAVALALLLTHLPSAFAAERIWTAGADEVREESWLSRKTGGFLSDGKPPGTETSRIELGPLGHPQIREPNRLSVLDPATGREKWSRTGDYVLPVGGTPYAIRWHDGELECIDYQTGETRWRTSQDAPVGGLEGFYSFMPIGDLGIVLLFGGRWRQQFTNVVAAELASGRPLWSSDEIFLRQVQKNGDAPAVEMLHPPLVDADGVVLFLDATGPVKIDPANGKVIWRSIPFQKAVFGSGVQPGQFHDPNWFDARTPPMFERDGRFFVVAGPHLYAFDMKSGKQLWTTSKIGGFMPKNRYATPVRVVVPSKHGLVVYGFAFEEGKGKAEGREKDLWVDLVDPASGKYRFKSPVRVFGKSLDERLLRASGRRHHFAVVGDWSVVAGGDRIELLDLREKKPKARRVDSPGGSAAIVQLGEHDGKIFVRGANWMSSVEPEGGNVLYTRRFEAPERSYWDQALDGAFALGMAFARQAAVEAFAGATSDRDTLARNLEAAEAFRRQNLQDLDARLAEIAREGSTSAADADAHAFFFAGDGVRGSSARNIEKVRKSDGRTVGTTPVDTGALDVRFVVDALRGRLYVNDDATIFAQQIE